MRDINPAGGPEVHLAIDAAAMHGAPHFLAADSTGKATARQNALRAINREISRLVIPDDIHEQAIEHFLSRVEACDPDERFPEYWLLTARLAEMALLCAGHYADQAEFRYAGDLLFNPRQATIFVNGRNRPMLKQRHTGISAQLSTGDRTPAAFACWFKEHADIEIGQGPLLADLLDRMTRSGRLSPDHLSAIRSRMRRVADTIVFLSAWGICTFADFHIRLRSLPPDEKAWVESNLCRFNRRRFNLLGIDIDQDAAASAFLSLPGKAFMPRGA